jgi:HAD superfamily hydrolase (TIGR01549 family)
VREMEAEDRNSEINFNRIKTVVVDIEGVIRDSKSFFHHAYEYALSKVGVSLYATPAETWKLRSYKELNSQREFLKALYCLGKKGIRPIQVTWKKDPVSFVKDVVEKVNPSEKVIDMLEKNYEEYISNPSLIKRVHPIRAGKKAIKLLKLDGYKVCAVTNSHRKHIEPWLKQRKIDFDILICGDEVKNKKPSPDPLVKICNLLETEPRETVYIGDTEVDILTAVNSNILPIAVYSGGSEKKTLRKLGAKKVYENLMRFYLDFKRIREKAETEKKI